MAGNTKWQPTKRIGNWNGQSGRGNGYHTNVGKPRRITTKHKASIHRQGWGHG